MLVIDNKSHTKWMEGLEVGILLGRLWQPALTDRLIVIISVDDIAIIVTDHHQIIPEHLR
ncbi:hypothetical protein [Paenibacillus sp. 2TAB26]|uniref:hypothetical protein n=1 Tax=Paenibacillus sp. 2TAB26 TaxID=3233005 RepID=UPI003F9A5470